MTLDEMRTLTTELYNNTIKPQADLRIELEKARAIGDGLAEDKALDELFAWRQARSALALVTDALNELERLK